MAAQLVKDSRGGDAISVILMGRPAAGRHRRPLAQPGRSQEGDRRAGASRTAAPIWRPPSRRSTDVLEVSSIAQKEVVFLTDLQAASWRPPAEATDGLKRVAGPARGPAAAVGRDRPGKVGRREPRGHRPEAGRPRRDGGRDRPDPRRLAQLRQRPAPTASARG